MTINISVWNTAILGKMFKFKRQRESPQLSTKPKYLYQLFTHAHTHSKMFTHSYLCCLFPAYKIYSVYFALEIWQKQSSGDSEKITRAPLAPLSLHLAHTCSCFLLISRWSWLSTHFPKHFCISRIKKYQFLNFGRVSCCSEFIVSTLPISRNFTTPSYSIIWREKL